ncbi:hypothetical protein EDD11_001041 [Mortierella claussenii]|nr:hypothetical protein EDD11_001041 [Mortierella claussenii]
MNFSNSNSAAEDSELLQYFFQQDDYSDQLAALLQEGPAPTTASTQAAPSTSAPPSVHTSNDSSQQMPSPMAAPQAQQAPASTIPIGQTTLLPSTSFSYRQLTPSMPPPMPVHMSSLAASSSLNTTSSFAAPVLLAGTSKSSSSIPAPAPLELWAQRFQQLQQLQQKHLYQQHQLLSSTLLSNNINLDSHSQETHSHSATSTQRGSSSERSVSPGSSSPPGHHGKQAIYPSPPMKDDISMDSEEDEHTDDTPDSLKPSASELKKMTSKERRQLRNKLSARNFRVRRKEYITTLENQVKDARREAADLQRRLIQSELNCQFLRQELETTRLSQSLFADGRMSKEHANLLASLLHPNSESFPSTTTTTPSFSSSNAASSNHASSSSSSGSNSSNSLAFMPTVPQLQQLQQPFTNPLALHSNQSALSLASSLMTVSAPSSSAAPSALEFAQASLQPFVPFDGDWGLLINRAEVSESTVDPKDDSSRQAVYQDLLAQYDAARQEAELDDQIRAELKRHAEKRLTQTYMSSPKGEHNATGVEGAMAAYGKNDQEELILQTLVYMMMIHLTQSLFEAATMSKSELVNVYQAMDAPLRTKMERQGRLHLCSSSCKFSDWREAWIRKCWPSFYNNRRRLAELFKNGPCSSNSSSPSSHPSSSPSSSSSSSTATEQKEVDVVETTRKMEEGVKGKTVEVPKVNYFVRHYLPTWLKCSEILERERLHLAAKAERKARSNSASSLSSSSNSNVATSATAVASTPVKVEV